MTRRVSVELDATVASYVAKMRQSTAATADLGKRIGATSKEVDAAQRAMAASADRTRAGLSSLGSDATRAGLVAAAGLGLVGKAAIDWESDFAGVRKTVSGTQPEIDALEQSLRQMAKTMPGTHREIAAVAEAAGQLGVKTPDVARFSRVMLDLGNTTNLTSDDAATSLAQFMNILGTAPEKVENLGSALVYLGNNGASTEKQILELGQRAAAAGGQIGLSEADVLGFASAITSTGQNVEAGGTAISKVFTKINTATSEGGAKLEGFARVAGLSASQFQRMFAEDSAGAIDLFVEGLGQIKASGGDVSSTLKELGIRGSYEIDTLGRLAGASKAAGREVGLLTENLVNGRVGFEQNTALAKEAATRYETTASKIAISWNKIKDSGIEAGGALLPVAADIADGLGKMATAFGDLPDPAKRSAATVVAVGAAGLLMVGGVAKAVSSVSQMRTSLRDLATESPRTSRALGTLGKAAAAAGAAMVALQIVGAISNSIKGTFTPTVEEAAKGLLDLAGTPGANLDDKFKFETGVLIKDNVDGLGSAFDRLNRSEGLLGFGDKLDRGLDQIAGTTDSLTGRILTQFSALDKGMQSLAASGNGEQAAASFAKIAAQAKVSGTSAESLVKLFPETAQAARSFAEANGFVITSTDQLVDIMSGRLPAGFKLAKGGADSLTDPIGKVATEAENAATSLEAMTKALNDQASAALAAAGSQDGVQSAINAAKRAGDDYVATMVAKAEADGTSVKAAKRNAEAALESGKALKGNSDASIALRESLRSVAAASLSNIEAMVNNGESTEAVSRANEKARRSYIDLSMDLGATKAQAKAMADELFGVGKIDAKPKITAPSDAALRMAGLTRAEFDKLPKDVKAKITALYNGGKAKEADAELRKVGRIDAKPKITPPSTAAKQRAENTTEALRTAGAQRPAPKITPPSLTAKERAENTTRALKLTGSQRAVPKITAPSDAARVKATQTTGALKATGAIRARPTITVTANTSAIGRVRQALAGLRDRVVNVITNKIGGATGGLATPGGFLYRSNGGPVWGAGTATSDSIDAKLSNGEFVLRAAAAKAIGMAELLRLNALGGAGQPQGLAAGGPVSAANYAAIFALIKAVSDPLRAIASATLVASKAAAAAAAANRAVAAPKANLDRAKANLSRATDARDDLRLANAKELAAAKEKVAQAEVRYQAASRKDAGSVGRADAAYKRAQAEVATARREAARTKGNTAADRASIAKAEAKAARAKATLDGARSRNGNADEARALARARAAQRAVSTQNAKELAQANAKVTASTKAKTAAQAAYDARAAKAKAASDAYADAQKNLADQQKAVADAARSASATFAGQFESSSTDARDWVTLMREGAAQAAQLRARLVALRAAGLNEATIQQIAGLGVANGLQAAQSIQSGGSSLVAALNAAARNLKTQTDLLGYLVATGAHAAGGPITGPGTGTSDSILARLSNGEYVVNARATAANRPALDAMNYGRAVVDRTHVVQHFAGGGYAQTAPLIDTVALAAAVRAGMAGMSMSATVNGDTVTLLINEALGGFVSQFGRGNA